MKWKITDKRTGRSVVFEGNALPSESEAMQLFGTDDYRPGSMNPVPSPFVAPPRTGTDDYRPGTVNPVPVIDELGPQIPSRYGAAVGPSLPTQYPAAVGPEARISMARWENPVSYAARTPFADTVASGVASAARVPISMGRQAIGAGSWFARRGMDVARQGADVARWAGSRVADFADQGAREISERVSPFLTRARAWGEQNLVAPAPPGKVRVISPDGQRGLIDVEEADLAERLGYTIVQ